MWQVCQPALKLLALLGVFILHGCGADSDAGGRQGSGTPEVGVVTIAPTRVVLTTQLPGRTTAYAVAEVRPQVSGILQARLFEEGSLVVAGQPLYQIDATLYQAALDSVQAQLASARAALTIATLTADRYASLRKEQSISQQDQDDAQAAVAQAKAMVAQQQAALQSARINLSYTRIDAPINGRIGRSYLTAGALVKADQDQALATIATLDPIYVDMHQSSTELMALKNKVTDATSDGQTGPAVTLNLEDGSPYALQGTLQFHEVVVDPDTGTVNLRARFPNPDGKLLPGMFVRATIVEGIEAAALLVPQRAVSRDEKGNATVLIVDAQGLVQQKTLQVGAMHGPDWLVHSGLAAGDQVIVEGLQFARPGEAANAVPYRSGGAATAGDAIVTPVAH